MVILIMATELSFTKGIVLIIVVAIYWPWKAPVAKPNKYRDPARMRDIMNEVRSEEDVSEQYSERTGE